MKKHMKWRKSEIIILSLLGMMGIAAIVALASILFEYSGGNTTYKALQEYVFLPEEPDFIPSTGAGNSGAGSAQTQQDGKTGTKEEDANAAAGTSDYVHYGQCPQVNFEALEAQNSDVVGWIYGPGTAINYPVVQGDDNLYYLNHLFDGKENKTGSIFMDSLNEVDFSNTNSILHGHHMRNGSMFASLVKYANQSYYDTHPVLWLVTPEKSYQVELFTGFVTDTESDAWQIEFANKEDYQKWLDEMVSNGAFKSDVKPGIDDKILTLATCSYDFNDARFVVMGILRETE